MPRQQSKKNRRLKKKYDFTLKDNKSKKDVREYFRRYGCPKTMDRLRRSLGKERIIDRLQFTRYTFKHYENIVAIMEDTTFPYVKKIYFVDL